MTDFMSREDVRKALPVIGLIAILGLFLPSLDTSWKSDPNNAELRRRVHMGEMMYLTLATGVGALASYANRTKAPLILAVTWSLIVVGMHQYAINHQPKRDY